MARMPVVLIVGACLLALAGTTNALASPGLPADWQRGANVTAWNTDAFAQPAADSSLGDLQATGTTNAAIVVTWYMDAKTSSTIAPRDGKTPSDASVLHAIARAKELGMRVTLKPHVDVWDGTFRGDITPASRSDWFASYRAMIDHYADLAAQAGADALIVGTELTTMTDDTAEWRALIAGVRARFGGQLTYAANWI